MKQVLHKSKSFPTFGSQSNTTIMETKHTKGKWYIGDENNSSEEVGISLPNGEELTISLDRHDRFSGVPIIDRDEMNANARLIAAAPDMLADLIDEVDFLKGLMQDVTNPLPIAVRSTIRFRIIVLEKSITKATQP